MTISLPVAGQLYENELASDLSLDGAWFVEGIGTSTMEVPSAWDAHADKKVEGPVSYRRDFYVPDTWRDGAIYLQALAVSFAATIWVNGHLAGEHKGMWSPFQIDITSFILSDRNTISIDVWKPGERYAVRECLAGFLPDVAAPFGGIWQSIRLRHFERAAIYDIKVASTSRAGVTVNGHLLDLPVDQPVSQRKAHWRGRLTVTGAEGVGVVASTDFAPGIPGDDFAFTTQIDLPTAHLWAPHPHPALYTVTLQFFDKEDDAAPPVLQVTRRIGLRDITSTGHKLLMNDQPLHVRGVLDWGWNADRMCPTPSRQQMLDQIAKARSLGFNMIKLCLFVPDETTFNVADEQGMLLWLELPMWLPLVTPSFRELALQEYRAILQRVHHHPSIVIVSLGCELNAAAEAAFLAELNTLVRSWLPNALHCDNSGSAEAYGGVVTALSDFNDYHFYTDPHFFQSLVNHFTRLYQPDKPWIYGEFCDADTLRDFNRLNPEPWWLTEQLPYAHPDLVRTQAYKQRLHSAGVQDGGTALTTVARRQATAIRKYIFEQVRSRAATGGYVITGWMDTPISTSGVVDDRHDLKYQPEEWQPFNNDCVLLIDRERRRQWRHGGDRPVHTDPFTWWQGDHAEIHIALSNGLGEIRAGTLHWEMLGMSDFSEKSDIPNISGSQPLASLPGGEVTELTVLRIPMSIAQRTLPYERILRVTVELVFANGEQRHITNSWQIWAIPDKQTCLERVVDAPVANTLASTLSDELLAQVSDGGHVLLWLQQPDQRFTRHMPFWREAIHLFAPHSFWQAVPHSGYADMRFFSVASDFALDLDALATTLGQPAQWTPIWRRFDARAMTWADYLAEVRLGAGRLFVSTLRFAGGLCDQPDTFETNPLGAWMLRVLIQPHSHPAGCRW